LVQLCQKITALPDFIPILIRHPQQKNQSP